MSIPEQQLETWSHQGAVSTAKLTADSIRNAINSNRELSDKYFYEVYLQGSYKNDTNIRGDSDVDVVVQLDSIFYNNLNELQKKQLSLSSAYYGLDEFRTDILKVLKYYYGITSIIEGNTSIKLKENDSRLPADIIISCKYRNYRSVNHADFDEGMCFWTQNDYRQIINFPKAHFDNGVNKHQDSGKLYKPAVRMFKNMRSIIPRDETPSYFLECMLYNVPYSEFAKCYQDSFCNIVNWLNKAELNNFVCQNEHLKLFGPTPEQWEENQAKEYINNITSLWKNWGKQ
ncbi:MAG: nucleotidyltransferase domain-containing protein [Candidatus Humimicrobiaceae bacterium]